MSNFPKIKLYEKSIKPHGSVLVAEVFITSPTQQDAELEYFFYNNLGQLMRVDFDDEGNELDTQSLVDMEHLPEVWGESAEIVAYVYRTLHAANGWAHICGLR